LLEISVDSSREQQTDFPNTLTKNERTTLLANSIMAATTVFYDSGFFKLHGIIAYAGL
jgi:hypothetical protein